MKLINRIVLIATYALVPSLANAFHAHQGKLEDCFIKATKQHNGTVLSVEAEISNKRPIYEFDIKLPNGKIIEVECDAKTSKLGEIEWEVYDELQPGFKEKAKLSLEEAKQIVLKKYPGSIVEIEFSIEADGNPAYEFDIKMSDGKEYEIEISAITGEILNVEQEVYQIGMD